MNPPKPAQVPDREPLARISYAQNMEDILLDRVFGGRPGTFMDVGANHPFLESNTYFFYLRGWRGVNLEPIPRNHALLAEHRPEDLNLAVAASDFDGELTFHEIDNGEGLTGHSSLSDEVAEQHRALGFAVESYRVPARTVGTLIAEHGIEPPDFLSVDVECHEGAVIRGIPWATWRPKVLVIESLLPLSHSASHESWEPTLLEHGYLFAAFNGLNRFYLREDLRDKLPLLQTPVNCLDHYQRADEALREAEAEELRLRAHYLQGQYDRLSTEREWDKSNFESIRAGWEWGVSQAELAKRGFDRQQAEFEWHRANFERAEGEFRRERERWDRERAERDEERSYHAWERGEWDKARAEWERERAGREDERSYHAWERAEWDKARAEWERERAGREDERSYHAWERGEWDKARAAWERERAIWERAQGEWASARAEFDREWASWEWERAGLAQRQAALEAECESLRQQLASTQRALRPYHLLDRLGVVSAGYGVARRVRRRLAR